MARKSGGVPYTILVKSFAFHNVFPLSFAKSLQHSLKCRPVGLLPASRVQPTKMCKKLTSVAVLLCAGHRDRIGEPDHGRRCLACLITRFAAHQSCAEGARARARARHLPPPMVSDALDGLESHHLHAAICYCSPHVQAVSVTPVHDISGNFCLAPKTQTDTKTSFKREPIFQKQKKQNAQRASSLLPSASALLRIRPRSRNPHHPYQTFFLLDLTESGRPASVDSSVKSLHLRNFACLRQYR